MNKREERLNRLYARARSAPDAPGAPSDGMPGHLRTRVLAQWRATATEEMGRSLAVVFRFALLGAAVVMLASIVWSFGELADDPENEVAIANYELREDVMP